MTARDYQSVVQVALKASASARANQAYIQVVAALQPAISMAQNYQSFIQVVARNYKVVSPTDPGPSFDGDGHGNRAEIPIMGTHEFDQ